MRRSSSCARAADRFEARRVHIVTELDNYIRSLEQTIGFSTLSCRFDSPEDIELHLERMEQLIAPFPLSPQFISSKEKACGDGFDVSEKIVDSRESRGGGVSSKDRARRIMIRREFENENAADGGHRRSRIRCPLEVPYTPRRKQRQRAVSVVRTFNRETVNKGDYKFKVPKSDLPSGPPGHVGVEMNDDDVQPVTKCDAATSPLHFDEQHSFSAAAKHSVGTQTSILPSRRIVIECSNCKKVHTSSDEGGEDEVRRPGDFKQLSDSDDGDFDENDETPVVFRTSKAISDSDHHYDLPFAADNNVKSDNATTIPSSSADSPNQERSNGDGSSQMSAAIVEHLYHSESPKETSLSSSTETTDFVDSTKTDQENPHFSPSYETIVYRTGGTIRHFVQRESDQMSFIRVIESTSNML